MDRKIHALEFVPFLTCLHQARYESGIFSYGYKTARVQPVSKEVQDIFLKLNSSVLNYI